MCHNLDRHFLWYNYPKKDNHPHLRWANRLRAAKKSGIVTVVPEAGPGHSWAQLLYLTIISSISAGCWTCPLLLDINIVKAPKISSSRLGGDQKRYKTPILAQAGMWWDGVVHQYVYFWHERLYRKTPQKNWKKANSYTKADTPIS